MKRFTVFHDRHAEFAFGPLGGWWWGTAGDQLLDRTPHLTPWGAWLAGWWATRTEPRNR